MTATALIRDGGKNAGGTETMTKTMIAIMTVTTTDGGHYTGMELNAFEALGLARGFKLSGPRLTL